MAEFTKEQLINLARENVRVLKQAAMQHKVQPVIAMDLRLAEIALAALTAGMEQEPVAWIVHAHGGDQLTTDGGYVANAEGMGGIHSTPLYTAPQLPQPAVQNMHHDAKCDLFRPQVVNGVFVPRHCDCRAAMLQGSEPVSQLYTLPAEVRDAINRLLDSDGSRGTFSAVRSSDAREELERLIAAAPQQEAE